MIRVVIDTNVVVSSTQNASGIPASILNLAANKKISMWVSAEVLAEYEEVLCRPHLKFSAEQIAEAMTVIRSTSQVVRPEQKLELAEDLGDNLFYECAEAAKADFLITGNTKHFLVGHEGTQIVTPREFIDHMNALLFEGSPEQKQSDSREVQNSAHPN